MALPTYSTGTVSLPIHGSVVTGVGTMWSGTNVKQGDFICFTGGGYEDTVLITEVTDATHLKIVPYWNDIALINTTYTIYQNYVGRVVGVAAAEDVGTMLEKLHTDGLPFIVDPALTAPDPSYGDDGQMAFQPTTGKWWTKTGGVWVLSPGLTSDSSKLPLTGGVLTGNLAIQNADPALILNKNASGHSNSIIGYKNSQLRWIISPGDATPETSGDTGSDFGIYRYSDAGTFLGTSFNINRATGICTLDRLNVNNSVGFYNTVTVSGAAYSAGYRIHNTAGPGYEKFIRLGATSELEIVNSAGSGVILTLTDGGQLTITDRIYAPGYATRAGQAGAYSGNVFNINHTGVQQLWIDSTNFGSIAYTSDYRIKKDITDLGSKWDVVKELKPVSYTHQDFTPPSEQEVAGKTGEPFIKGDDIERWGFIAHELQATLIESAASGVKDAPDHIQSPDPWPVIAALTKALQEAMARIEALEASP